MEFGKFGGEGSRMCKCFNILVTRVKSFEETKRTIGDSTEKISRINQPMKKSDLTVTRDTRRSALASSPEPSSITS